jgi:hypothetical protein
MRRLALATCLALLTLAATGPVAAQQYYKWKDANGVTHYTKTPPPAGTEAERLAVQAAPASPAAAPDAEAPAQGDGMTAEATQKRGAACEAARNNLTTLQDNPFVSLDKDGDGKPELLTTEEHNAQLAIAREQVRTLCPAQPAG